MQFQLFNVPISDDGSALEELNRFLRSHKVLEVEQQLISLKNGGQWHFCVKYLANAIIDMKPTNTTPKIDYKEVLDEKTFAVFSLLREFRKTIAETHGLPVYAVFTNEELANIAKLEEINIDSLKKIHGIGEKKAERFGKQLVELYTKTNTE
ncbi:MAG: HRDC domain-containing protein [Prevotellaceae bacterium]|jgi:superfamily II DNA helicase RecQ|nr:HRDC domain-containing protein [Prevotellaceae bacterium]